MGARSDRITADDFVTPPELQAWRLAPHSAGRIGGVRLRFANQDGRTTLAECYQQIPLRVLPPFHLPEADISLLYLLNPTAGLLDGDAQLVQIHAGPGTRMLVVGQSATRIHPAVNGFCTQQFRIHVERDAVLTVLPGPAIPFQGCRYYQHVDIVLEEGAGFVWGDLWQAGRHTRGRASERFRFDWLIQNMTVRRGEQLVYRDRFVWRGPCDVDQVAWHFGNHLAWANLFSTGTFNPPETSTSIRQSWFPTEFGDTCIRWLGDPELLTSHVVAAALTAHGHGGEQRPKLAELFAAGNLAPNHWFHCFPAATV